MITVISATNRTESNSLHVANYFQKKLNEKGVETKLLSLKDLPKYDVSLSRFENENGEFQSIQEIIFKTEKFIFILPEYNGSFPGILKLFIDSCKYPQSFRGKKSALIGIATGKYGNIRGVDHFTGICHYVGMNVLPLKLHIPGVEKELNQNFDFFQEDTLKFTNQLIEQFIGF